jgi:2-succinyl-5-enolpyruvyl-6-hydroxy-3-cyclohexene-1-carboxylate synthase
MTDTRMANTLWARAFMDELARAGVREICVAPGSRSTPLVLAAAADGRFRMFPILDERSAGFFALGIGKASQWPAAVITTSGTATANLYPAVIEASQGEVPILLLSADRPHRLRDTDGNQAIDQVRLFGTFPRAFFEVELPRLDEPALRHLRALAGRAVALALGPPRGPVHLNFPFEKPLEPPGVPGGGVAAFGREGANPHTRVAPVSLEPSEEAMARLAGALASARRGLIVAGPVPDAGRVAAAVLALGEATGFPVLADPLSGARFSPSHGARVVAGYDLFLRSPEARRALAPDLVLRVGGSPTSSALLAALEEWGGATQVVVDDGHRWKDHPATAHGYVRASPRRLLERLAGEADRTADDGWIRMWGEAEARTREVVERRGPGELLEGEILASVVEGLPEGANLLVASSMPIRDLDAFGVPGDELLNVFGNRGASGIDGLVSTTLGIAVGAGGMAGTGGTAGLEGATMGGGDTGSGLAVDGGAAVPTVGVLGDLAFFHDMNGLMAVKALGLWVIFVVVNNDGGGIFHTLPVRDHEPAFTRFFATPHGLDFRKAAELFGIRYFAAASLREFEAVFPMALASGDPAIVEIRTRREATHARRRKLVEAVLAAARNLRAEDDLA